MKPHYVQVRSEDNVAIVVNPEGLPAGTTFDSGLSLGEFVPHANKAALVNIGADQPIRRYGAVIGYAERDIAAGTWVREDLVRMPEAPPLESLALATEVPPTPEPLEGYTFEGFRNRDGSVGTKNILGLATTVQCVAPTVDHAIARIRAELLPRFPNVDDVISVSHAYGCGVAIDAPDAAIPIRSIGRLARHPNLGGEPLVVSLGCEKMQPDRLLPQSQLLNAGKGLPPVLELQPYVMRLQDEELRGFGSMVEAIMRFAERRLAELNARRRVTCPAADLVVGVQCGGSDALSGVTANPAVGFAADLLVRAGASVMFSEVTEVRDAVHLLTPRCASEDIAHDLIREMRWYDDYLARGRSDRSANTTPGNKRGGLANIVEKALGSVAKSGTMALTDVISHGEKIRRKGLTFAATPAGDFVCGTQQLAAGMNLHVFTTGRGTPYGLAMAPVIKVSSNTALADRWYDLIDLDAGRIASGEATIEQVGWELFRMMLDVASGRKKVWTDHWGLHNALSPFNPGPVT